VWIDIPLDVQAANIDPDALTSFEPPISDSNEDLSADIGRVLDLIAASRRPILLAGNGVRLARATAELHELVAMLNVPSQATWLSCDLFDYDDPLYIGKPGTMAPRGVNFALQNADLLLILGARVDSTITGFAPERLARGARKVMVDIDPAELAKLKPHIDIPICADALKFLRALLHRAHSFSCPDWSAWIDRCRDWKQRYPVVLPEHREPAQKVSVYRFGEVLSEQLPADQVIVSGSSGAGIEIFQHVLKLKRGQRLLHTAALGAMGYGLPAAVGACLASGGRPTVCIDGDGGLQLNIQELETVRRLNLPIKFFILSNEGYSSIRTSQTRWFGRLSGADSTSGLTLPNLLEVASAYGLPTARIADQSDLNGEVRSVLSATGPIVCEVVTIPDEQRIPTTASAQRADGSIYSKPIEDLWPFLERDEFLANMIVPPAEDQELL
jgi:acetolactate synthase-1/2/3 large subunit